jgi:hypothetical protein
MVGGGIFCNEGNQKIINCVISDNRGDDYGAGICLWQDSNVLIKDCTIRNNIGKSRGGGISANLSTTTIVNCIITGNIDLSPFGGLLGGGGIFSRVSSVKMNNSVIVGNLSTNMGGGAHFHLAADPRVEVTDCIFWDNEAPDGPQIRKYMSNAYVTYCDVEGGWWDGLHGNIDIDPCFVDAVNGDYHLKSQAGRWYPDNRMWVTDSTTSPCIDTGDPASDWTAELWPHGKRKNMGTYGGTPQASMSLSSDGNIANLDNDPEDNVNLIDLAIMLEAWCLNESLLAEDLNRDGIVDFLDYAILSSRF